MPINEEYRFRKDFALLCDLFLFRPQRRRHGSEGKKSKKKEKEKIQLKLTKTVIRRWLESMRVVV